MKNRDLFRIVQGINLVSELRGAKFSYAMAKNKRVLIAEIEDLQKAVEMADEYNKYDKQRIELCEKFSKKDKNGEPAIVDNEYEIEDRKTFDDALDALGTKHKEVIDERKKQIDDFNELLDKPINGVAFHKISHDDLPDNITPEQTDAIFELIT